MSPTFTNTKKTRKACFSGLALANASFYAMGVFTLGFLTGCGGGEPEYVEVQEVSVAPEEDHSGHDHAAHEGHDHAAEASGVGFTYELPQGWVQKAQSNMVLLAFQTGNPPELFADLSISAFPGDVGGQAANVNRWRRQIGLGPVDPDTALSLIRPVDISGMDGWQVDLTGPEGAATGGVTAKMVVSAVFHDGKTWFFKFVGPDTVIDGELERYSSLIDSVTF